MFSGKRSPQVFQTKPIVVVLQGDSGCLREATKSFSFLSYIFCGPEFANIHGTILFCGGSRYQNLLKLGLSLKGGFWAK